MTPLERLARLRDHLLSLDSGSGEACDISLALDALAIMVKWKPRTLPFNLARAIDDLTTESTNAGK